MNGFDFYRLRTPLNCADVQTTLFYFLSTHETGQSARPIYLKKETTFKENGSYLNRKDAEQGAVG